MRLLHNSWYWLKCRLWYRYNVVVCKPLPPTWQDRDYLLLYAAFQILEDFIRKEQPWEFTGDVYTEYAEYNIESARQRDKDWKVIRELYTWWSLRKDNDEHDDYEEDTKMLHKLINMRKYLWT